MDTFTIKKLLKTYKCFKGVFPSDQLPYECPLPLNIIVNTDPSTKPGQHWVAISITSTGKGYYFDSFGLSPLVDNIFKFINTKAHNGWTHNKFQIQNIRSSTCGNYCVFFIIIRCNELEPKDLIRQFGHNTAENDDKMRKIFKNFSLVKNLS